MRSHERFCEIVSNHVFGVDVFDFNVAGGYSVFDKKMSDVDMTRFVSAVHAIVAQFNCRFIVLVDSRCWNGVAKFKEIVANIDGVSDVVGGCDVFAFEGAFSVLLEASCGSVDVSTAETNTRRSL